MNCMGVRIRARGTRLLDCGVMVVAIALVTVPFIPRGSAALIEQPVTVHQRVKQAAFISLPQAQSGMRARTGKRTTAEVSWRVFSTAGEGYKLVISTNRRPAMSDRRSGAEVEDLPSTLQPWRTVRDSRRFGFTAGGRHSLDSFRDGRYWRGLDGRRGVEVARRRSGPVAQSTTNVRFASEIRDPLPEGARPKAYVLATATINL